MFIVAILKTPERNLSLISLQKCLTTRAVCVKCQYPEQHSCALLTITPYYVNSRLHLFNMFAMGRFWNKEISCKCIYPSTDLPVQHLTNTVLLTTSVFTCFSPNTFQVLFNQGLVVLVFLTEITRKENSFIKGLVAGLRVYT